MLVGTLAIAWLGAAPLCAHEIKPGEQLTLVFSDSRPGGEQVGQTYFSGAFPLAQANGMRELTTFKVQKTLVGGRTPQGSGLYLWPSREAAQRTRNDATYIEKFRPLRTQVWNELQSIDVHPERAMTVDLDRSKTYTAALVWVTDEAAYQRYSADVRRLLERKGVQTVLDLPGRRYENLKEGETAPPDHVVLLEWPTAEALAQHAEDAATRALEPQQRSSVAKIEWYQLGFWDQPAN
jgi:uncharacterized protein (DUF1330 family)